ncbi:flavodoxin domain-containing protein [Leucobacter sp. NPDC058333]|uniref:flavodoxin domain-containing protein n=1 Tax=Leucobacter sp. NPDC058333 TaxID=3346450 RepID=UPI003661880B
MKFTILYGTESGNSELIAEDLGDHLRTEHDDVIVQDLQHTNPAEITADRLVLVVCSTHGAGDLPNSAEPFARAFDADPPELTGVRYAMFGLGDRFYEETYSQGSEHIDRRFAAQGAERIGPYGRHDASSWDVPSDTALEWLPEVLAAATADANA